MRWFIVPLFACFRLFAQPAPQDDLLERIRLQMLRNLQEEPNYTCTETIERYYRSSPARKFQLQDTLRLEVALVEGKEMYAFPGAKKFDAVPLNEMVGDTGAISNGDFALHARSVFGTRGATFEYKGTGSDAGRNWVRFDYDVALQVSHFELKHGSNRALTAYHGSFDADPSTLDLQRLTVVAEDIPSVIGFKKAVKELSFARIKIGDGTFLLPAESELKITELSNAENLNRSKFSGCRQFAGESTLTFDDPSAAPAAPAVIEEVTLPDKIELALALSDTIDSRNVAIGDPVTARMIGDAKFKSRTVVPKGAIARGRVTRADRHTDCGTLGAERHADCLILGIELMEIEWPGAHAVLHADLDRIPQITGGRRLFTMSTQRQHEGLMPLTSTQSTLPRGFLMIWTTAPQNVQH